MPTLAKAPFSNPAWIFEPKDGIRALCYVADGEARFLSRRRNAHQNDPALQSVAAFKAEAAILDGEIVALDKDVLPTLKVYERRVLLTSRLFISLSI